MPDAADLHAYSPSANPVTRLYFKTYLQMVHNAVGTQLFRNFYVRTEADGEFDSLGDGEDSCAFFVSSIVVLMQKGEGVHGTVAATVQDLERSGWEAADTPRAGDILVWEPRDDGSEPHHHIGFAIGDGQAISNSSSQRSPQRHDLNFGDERRQISAIYRHALWDALAA
jgi:hypothetical protein